MGQAAKGIKTYDEIREQVEIFLESSEKFNKSNTQSAGIRARRALDRIAKLKVQWRKETCGNAVRLFF